MMMQRRCLRLAIAAVLLLGAALSVTPPVSRAQVTSVQPAAESWTALPSAGAPTPRGDHTAVWTGQDMLIWGGHGKTGDQGDGARYHPASNTWSPISPLNARTIRAGATAVWTGSEMILWGGYGGTVNHPHPLNDGGRYNPSTDTWLPLPAVALATRVGNTAVWTGSEMIVWGGQHTGLDGTKVLGDGAAYNPVTDTWRMLPNAGAPLPMAIPVAVWTGTEMLVWGQTVRYAMSGPEFTQQGSRYNPVTNAWTPISSVGAPDLAGQEVAVWTGGEMLVWGRRFKPGSNQTTDGGRYNPALDIWTPISLSNAPGEREQETAIWTGRDMIIWGGTAYPTLLGDGARYNPATDTWHTILADGVPTPRAGQSAVWTGIEMIIWGGYSESGLNGAVGDGARYVPPLAGAAPSGVPALLHDDRYFAQTGYRIDDATIWNYFNRRGGLATFGYPTSRLFVFQGFPVQFFQCRVVQLDAGGQARLLNVLDAGLLPYQQFNGSTFPDADTGLLTASPDPSDATATLAFVHAHAPDTADGMPVNFYQTFLSTVALQDAFPTGGDPGLLPSIDLELWGLPTSLPLVDPKNHNFISLRWQRGIMLYDAGCACTQGILLADYLKQVLRASSDLPHDLTLQAGASSLYAQYCPGATHWLCRPAALPGTDLTAAFQAG